MVTREMLALLEELGTTEHRPGRRPLLEHLEGTRAVLARWGTPTEICLAGRFHSVSTLKSFRPRSASLRAVPVAVVLSKTDALSIGIPPAQDSLQPDDPASGKIRQWLIDHGEGNLVRSIEHDFPRVRYFSCSALGHLPDGTRAFRPAGILPPLQWALERHAPSAAMGTATRIGWKREAIGNAFGVLVASLALLLLCLVGVSLLFRVL